MTDANQHSDQLLVMNLGAKERAEAAVSTLRERGESAKQPSLLTALGHDVLLALTIIERLEEQYQTAEQALRAYHAIFTAWEGHKSITLNEEALRQWKSIAETALSNPAKEHDA